MKKKKPVPFRLRDVVKDSLHYLLFTTLPTDAFIKSLRQIADSLGKKINQCIDEAYYLVTRRNGSGEGHPSYFPHLAATALYEASSGEKIKDKDHGIKAGMLLNKLFRTLTQVKEALKNKKLAKEPKRILRRSKAELIGQINATLFALKTLPRETRTHLRKHQNLHVKNMQFLTMRERYQKKIEQIHPTPVDETPKKASSPAKRSRDAILADAPPTPPKVVRRSVIKRLF